MAEQVIESDLSNVDLQRPLIKGLVLCRTGELSIDEKQSKKGEMLKYLNIPLQLEEVTTSTEGKSIQPGFTITDRILITPTGGLTQERVNERLARFQIAALAIAKPTTFGAVSQYSGKLIKVKLDTRPDKMDPTTLFQDIVNYSKA